MRPIGKFAKSREFDKFGLQQSQGNWAWLIDSMGLPIGKPVLEYSGISKYFQNNPGSLILKRFIISWTLIII